LVLPKGAWYTGFTTINFKLVKMPSADIWLDFRGVKIANMKVNGQETQPNFKGQQVPIARGSLKMGQNQVTIHFCNKYRNDGNGLHSYVDSVDGLQYLYT